MCDCDNQKDIQCKTDILSVINVEGIVHCVSVVLCRRQVITLYICDSDVFRIDI